MRYRRGTAGLIKAAQAKALAEALCPAMTTDVDNPYRAAEQLALRWTKGDQAAIDEVTTLLDPSETTDIALIAPAISLKIDDIERIDRMVRTKEARRDRCLSEIEVHRLSTFLIDRQMTEVVHDAEVRLYHLLLFAERSAGCVMTTPQNRWPTRRTAAPAPVRDRR